MTSATPTTPEGGAPSAPRRSLRRRLWPWACLALALGWSAAIRVPLVMNARAHLDSDLAVDGLTLVEATQGQWRWHFPGTPHMGIGPILLAYPQAMVWGANAFTLVSGGVIAYLAFVLVTFLLALRAFGKDVAAWSLVPTAFCSTGMIWLSGRLTGGHLLTLAWHSAALLLLHECLSRGGLGRAAALGLWCGLGYYLDTMFAISTAAVGVGAVVFWWSSGRRPRAMLAVPAFAAAFVVGYLPHEAGVRADPYDCYNDQFQPIFAPDALAEHARLLVEECLPRLVSGHRLSDGASEPRPSMLHGAPRQRNHGYPDGTDRATLFIGLAALVAAFACLAAAPSEGTAPAPAADGVRWAALSAAAAVVALFVFSKNIYNSDNYRYLIYCCVPAALGFGLAGRRLTSMGAAGAAAAVLAAALFAGLMSTDTYRWYRRFGWVAPGGWPLRVRVRDRALNWLDEHPEVVTITGSYWDVYRVSFLTGGRVRGVPFGTYPNRYANTRAGGPDNPTVLIERPNREGAYFWHNARARGGRALAELEGGGWIASWP